MGRGVAEPDTPPAGSRLLVPQRDYRVYAGRPPGWEIARQERKGQQQGRNKSISGPIRSCDTEKEGTQEPGVKHRAKDSAPDPQESHPQPLTNDEPNPGQKIPLGGLAALPASS